MITCEVKRINRDHELLAILEWDDDHKITSKHFKAGSRTAFELASEGFENDSLLILIYDEDFKNVLKLNMETYSALSYIWADLYTLGSSVLIKRMDIAR